MDNQFKRMITGAAGFIGGHLCRKLATASEDGDIASIDLHSTGQRAVTESLTDIRSAQQVSGLAGQWSAPAVIHLAAMAEVVMPFSMMPDLTATNIEGTINILRAFRPKRFVFASSSAVYGNVYDRNVRPLPGETAAIGAYGVSKVMGEVISSEWAEEVGSTVVTLRFGNVIGPGCRGLIPYLVAHALKHPDGSVPAQLRGRGRIIRDYVPVEFAVDAIIRSAELPLEDGRNAIFNVGSGYGLSNREVAEVVAETLHNSGYQLEMNFDNPVPAGESESVVLDVSDTSEHLGARVPDSSQVRTAIEQATRWHLDAGNSGDR